MENWQSRVLFSAQYLGQQVFVRKIDGNEDAPVQTLQNFHLGSSTVKESFLLLRGVDQLTIDEIKLISSKFHIKQAVFTMFDGHWYSNATVIALSQYLVRLGVLVPFTYIDENGKPVTLQPDQIIELGWAELQ